jgi:hypothetical protein
MKLKLEFSGGLELIFNKNKKMEIEVERDTESYTILDLIAVLREKISEKPEFFLTKDNQM